MSALVKFRKKFGAFSLSVDFEAENEVLALLGGSGCGKSMTLKCIAGIVTPDEGKIVVDGVTFFDSERGVNLSSTRSAASTSSRSSVDAACSSRITRSSPT